MELLICFMFYNITLLTLNVSFIDMNNKLVETVHAMIDMQITSGTGRTSIYLVPLRHLVINIKIFT